MEKNWKVGDCAILIGAPGSEHLTGNLVEITEIPAPITNSECVVRLPYPLRGYNFFGDVVTTQVVYTDFKWLRKLPPDADADADQSEKKLVNN